MRLNAKKAKALRRMADVAAGGREKEAAVLSGIHRKTVYVNRKPMEIYVAGTYRHRPMSFKGAYKYYKRLACKENISCIGQ